MILALLLAQAAAKPTCPAVPTPLPKPLAGWTQSGADLASMRAVTVPTRDPATLRPADVPQPDRGGRVAIVDLRIRHAGTYGIALGSKGWIDVLPAGTRTPLASTQHGHGPDCSGIRKIVRFTLAKGDYRVVAAGIEGPTAKLMLVR